MCRNHIEGVCDMVLVQSKKQEVETLAVPFSEEEKRRFTRMGEKRNQFEVAFCGHFSAGKSTILNTLLGAEVLPTSPIPTSANVIGIENGDLAVSVLSSEGEEKEWKGEIPWEQVRSWGMDGQAISAITIRAPLPFLGEYSTILDTPGVDSTDDSHQAVTVDQLFTTDFIVYVMDYNHVQSETNLYFLKQLSKEKKPLFIIINQIDKHNEKEIPISMFRQSVEDVFSRWDIHYLRLFFTTMKHPEHSLNQFPQFEKAMKGILYNSEQLLRASKKRLYESFYQAVKARLSEEKIDGIESVKQAMKEQGFKEDALLSRKQLEAELEAIMNGRGGLQKQADEELSSLFANVTLFPYTTTELARQWIESMQPGFKVGLLFSKKKTEQEQETRLVNMMLDLQDKVKTQLLFHVQKYFQQIDRLKLSNEQEVEDAITALDFQVTAELLKSHLKADYANREYVYNYTKEVTTLIIRQVKAMVTRLIELIASGMETYWAKRKGELQAELAEFQSLDSYMRQIEETAKVYDEALTQVEPKLQQFADENEYERLLLETAKRSYEDVTATLQADIKLPDSGVIDTSWEQTEEELESEENQLDEAEVGQWLKNVKTAITSHADNEAFSRDHEQILERIERFENQTFMISLFGAFSAGKSSFANALLGDAILPVSPNPTTATVNTVQKSTEDHPHGTALVYVKSTSQLDEEISAVAKQLDEKLSLDSIGQWQLKLSKDASSWQKTYGEYLQTLKSSLKETTWELGSSFSVSLEEMQSLVGVEKNACLLDRVTIYYDCPITEKGIILVDTPGVNSIHGRHTNVAFQQLRQSDAIFYLSYYNHAFSKADQYFLQQMAKVNESFSHDKLYFVLNAEDLAKDAAELNGVKKHVYDQLERNGIMKPRLYSLSSRQGLAGKKDGTFSKTSFAKFERAFYQYTIAELKKLSIDMIRQELQTLVAKLSDSLQLLKSEESTQKERFSALQTVAENEKTRIRETNFAPVIRDIQFEQEQLLLYLRERIGFVLADYFPHAINTATINADSKKALLQQLSNGLKEWRGLGEYFIKQELEATLIRLEAALKTRGAAWLTDQVARSSEQFEYLSVQKEFEVGALTLPKTEGFIDIQDEDYFHYIKSKRSFFEEGYIKRLREDLVESGKRSSQVQIEALQQPLTKQLQQKGEKVEQLLKTQLMIAIDDEVKRFEAMLDPAIQSKLEAEESDLKKYVI